VPLALLAMALVLLLGYGPGTPRLHLLVLPVLAATLTAGIGVVLGIGLTPATAASISVVIALTVDSAMQLQARYWRERGQHEPDAAARRAIVAMARILSPAGAARGAGFAVLMISAVPVLSRLGATLLIGTVVSLVTVLFVGGRLLAVRDAQPVPRDVRLGAPRGRWPVWAVAVTCMAAGAGLAVATQAPIESGVAKLLASGQPELRAVEAVHRELRTSGQLRIAVWGDNVASPVALEWMRNAQLRIERLDKRLEPGLNLGELLLSGASDRPTAEEVRGLLRVVPAYVVNVVMARDDRRADMSIGIPAMPAQDWQRLLRRIDGVLSTAPPGLHVEPVGLLASEAESINLLRRERIPLLLLEALSIVSALALCHRRLDRALVAFVPALLAAGASGLGVRALGLQLTPLSTNLEMLVLAVGTAFGVPMDARYRELRLAGLAPGEAADRARRTAALPVTASAVTVILGFLVLVLSDSAVVQQFGALVAFGLVLSLVAAVAFVTPLAAGADRRQMERRERTAVADGGCRPVGAGPCSRTHRRSS
jgi:predicted RND superfamily exporter protein